MNKRVFQWWQMAATMVAAFAVSAFGQVGNGSTGDYNYAPLTLVSTTTQYIDAGAPGVEDGTWQVKVDTFKNNTSSTLRIYANSYAHSNWQHNPPFQIGGQYAVQPGETFSFRATWNGDGPGWPMGVNGWQKITQIDVQAPTSATLTLTITRAGTVIIKQGGTTHGSLTNSGSGSVTQSFTLPTGTYTFEATAGSNHTQGDWSGAGLSGNTNTATLALTDNTSISKTFLATLTELGFTIQSRTFTYSGGEHPLHIDASLNDGQYTLTASPSPFQSPVGTQTGDKALGATNVGTYTATATPVSPYTGLPVTGTLTITQAPPTITWNPQPITYGTPLGPNQLNATATFVLANGTTHTVNGTVTYNQPTGTILGAGTHTLTGRFTSSDGNFSSVDPISATLTVAKASLRVTGSSHSREYKAANPSFSVSYSGFVAGESAANLTTQPTASTTATAASPIGDYNVTPAGGVSNNYTFDYVAGRLTITRKSVTFSFGNLSNQRTGASFTAAVTPSDAEATYTSALSYGPAVGDYPVSATATGNYSGSGSATATVTQEAPDVSASISSSITSPNAPGAATITWSSSNATSVSVTGNGLSSVQGSGSQSVSGLAAGTYTYTITAQGKNGPAVKTTTVTIAAAQPNVTATIAANPTSATAPGSTTITWSSEYATAVSVTGPNFTTSSATSGSQTVTGLATGTHTYTITAQGTGGPAVQTATVTIGTAQSNVTATISANPTSATAPGSATITWSSSNATAVSVTGPSFTSSSATSGSQTVTGLPAGDHTYTITAQGAGGPVTGNATVKVTERPTGTVKASVTATRVGNRIWRVAWRTENATSSLLTMPAGSGLSNSTAASGEVETTTLADGSYEFVLVAQGQGGPAVARDWAVEGGMLRTAELSVSPRWFMQAGGTATLSLWVNRPGPGLIKISRSSSSGRIAIDAMSVTVPYGTKTFEWQVPANATSASLTYVFEFYGTDQYGGWASTFVDVYAGARDPQTVTLNPSTATAMPGQTVVFNASGGNTGYIWAGTSASEGARGEVTVPSDAVGGSELSVSVYSPDGASGGRIYAQSSTATATVTVLSARPTVSLRPVASQITIEDPENPLHGRSYPRLWNEGGWSAYLGRPGVTFEVSATGSPALQLLTLEAKSPQTDWTVVGTQTPAAGPGTVGHSFSLMLGDVVPGEPWVPATFRAGSADTGVWRFRARAQDARGTWSEYSEELPVNVLLPIASRTVTGQTVPPVGPTGDWFTASPVANFSFSLWIP